MQSYQATLARRLILGLTVDQDIEEEMCRWLQNLGMPAEVINRMIRMFGWDTAGGDKGHGDSRWRHQS